MCTVLWLFSPFLLFLLVICSGVYLSGLPNLPWISMDNKFGINVIFACHRMGWLNKRLNYSLDLDLTCACFFLIFFVFF